MDDEKLGALREAAKRARPGPWHARDQFVSLRIDNTGVGGTLHTHHVATCADRDDAAYIAKADPTTIIAILDRNAYLEARESGRSAEGARVIDTYQVDQDRLISAEKERDELRAKVAELQRAYEGAAQKADSHRLKAEDAETKLTVEIANRMQWAEKCTALTRERDALRAEAATLRDGLRAGAVATERLVADCTKMTNLAAERRHVIESVRRVVQDAFDRDELLDADRILDLLPESTDADT